MKLTRRDFLKWSSLSAIGAVSCDIFREGEMEIQSPVEIPEDAVTGRDNWYATLCGQCPEREALVVRVMEGRAKKVRGNPLYPTNQGKQSVRCEGGLQALYHPDRIGQPMRRKENTARGDNQWWKITWDEVMDIFRDVLGTRLRDSNQAGSVLMVTEPTRGHLGLVVDSFVEAYGGRHLAVESLEQANFRTSMKQVYSQDVLPDFDIENTRHIISFGADFLSTWVSPVRYARGFGRFRAHGGGKPRGRLVQVDARYSMTAASADDWIPITPGMEGVLALSIAYSIISDGNADPNVVQAMIGGIGPAALESALGRFKPENVVDPGNPLYIGIPERLRGESAAELIRRVARQFGSQKPSLAIGGGTAGAHTNGLANLTAIYALNFLVNSVGKQPGEGGVVFNPPSPITGVPASSGAASFKDWLGAIDGIADGSIKALLVHGANPDYRLPGPGFGDAIKAKDDSDDLFVISFSNFLDDTSLLADLVLPIRDPLEEWGDDIPEPGPGHQLIGIQQPVVNPLPDLDPRSFPDLLLSVSQELGLDDGLPDSFEKVLKDGAKKLFDLNRGAPLGDPVDSPTFDHFWNSLLERGGWSDESRRSTDSPPAPTDLAAVARGEVTPTFLGRTGQNSFNLVPFLSISLLDGRGAHLPWLQATPDPLTTVTWQTWIEINSRLAEDMGLKEGDVVNVISDRSSIEAVVYPHPAMPPWVVGIPVGQGHTPGVQYATRDGKQRGGNPISILDFREDMDNLPWAATRVVVQPTGRSVRVSKFEGIVAAYPIGTRDEDIIQVTSGKAGGALE